MKDGRLTIGPVVIDGLCNVPGRVRRGEQELLCLAANEDQAEVYLQWRDKQSMLNNCTTMGLKEFLLHLFDILPPVFDLIKVPCWRCSS